MPGVWQHCDSEQPPSFVAQVLATQAETLPEARCARTYGLATPRLAVDIEDVRPWMALGLALTNTLGLQEALVTGLAAALRFSAIVGARGADILDPIGHEVGPIERRRGGRCSGAEGVAVPRLVAPRLGRVEAQRARRLALRP
eukprot:CAMPEP_0177275750 /NCGR_PEP_ID=MMETSP0367-20130122/67892_1 /TAXON_ID=447022 ORGANISM="Scrippsiella hangoei-like, Strain SHHI-4" /NCGR_SAMPLE_ID=MMETSP0367 /ASSEMBLY_ACC=CAM_ASM_000362 /LENGTH=142 /DNA_ID=CAMNT_0018732223 /DNA_START=18 /DNA_END=442 /DNA_ORIENTATION=+